nr:MAG: hypothetical protein 3 [Leviviridae sp.]
MMKSLVANAQTVLTELFRDIRQAYPMMSSLDRDRERLFTLMKTRGLSSLMIDLPNLRTLLLRGLETGCLSLEGPLSCAVSKRTKVPRLFSGLWLHVFTRNGVLRDFPDTNAIFFLQQLTCMLKNVELECSYDRKLLAVEEYYNVEEDLRSPTLLWADSEFDTFGVGQSLSFTDWLFDNERELFPGAEIAPGDRSAVILLAARLQRICDSVAGELGYFDPYGFTESVGKSDVTERFLSHGRGSVSDLGRHADKYALPGWSERLQRVFPNDAFGHYRFDNTLEYQSWKEVQSSKLIAVPKTLAKPRLIASEPTSHQWCQQITLRWLIQRMRTTRLSWFLDLTDQRLSQNMVYAASLPKTGNPRSASSTPLVRPTVNRLGGQRGVARVNPKGRLDVATVDLSSASDRLSCWAIERFLRKNPVLLSALQASRTPFLNDGISGRDAIFLKKFATQGTGVTFPIQSLFFLCCVLASLGCNTLKDSRKWKGRVRVYGDDIIIPVHGYENLRLLLHYLQLKVNDNKSFVHGEFRESCGVEAYRGDNITPICPKTLVCRGPKSERAMLDTSNNLHLAGLWHTAAWFERQTRRREIPVVGLGLGAVGRISFCGSDVSHLKSRWNQNLHRHEVRCRGFVSTQRRKPYNSSSGIFQFFAENPSQDQKWSSGVDPESRLVTRAQWVAVTDFLVESPSFYMR